MSSPARAIEDEIQLIRRLSLLANGRVFFDVPVRHHLRIATSGQLEVWDFKWAWASTHVCESPQIALLPISEEKDMS